MIELFKEPNIDWMGKAKYFYALSGILLLVGLVSVISQGGIRYGLDFKGRHQRGCAFCATAEYR